jgi:hypothetical protein
MDLSPLRHSPPWQVFTIFAGTSQSDLLLPFLGGGVAWSEFRVTCSLTAPFKRSDIVFQVTRHASRGSKRLNSASSALPYRRTPPTWLKTTSEEVVENIIKMARKGLQPSAIGIALRDGHGIPQVVRYG